MKIAIMQPYFLPYIGYFQLINAVDKFVVYDEIEYTKKGWINRNQILNTKFEAEYISLPLKKDSDYLFVNKRQLSFEWNIAKIKLKNKIKASYSKAPYFDAVYSIIEEILDFEDKNLFNFILNSILKIIEYLEIKTEIIISSSLNLNNSLKAENKVLEICKKTSADQYINPIGGRDLYSVEEFQKQNVKLSFHSMNSINYPQYSNEFVPSLSIIDLLMFNSKVDCLQIINRDFTLI